MFYERGCRTVILVCCFFLIIYITVHFYVIKCDCAEFSVETKMCITEERIDERITYVTVCKK